MTAYEWVQGDHETVETDLTTLDGAPSDLDLTGRTVHFVLRHYTGAKVADKEASDSGTTATVELTPANLSRTSSHEAEWVITDGADDPTSLPKDEPISVDVRPSVDDDDNVADPLPEDGTVDVLTANGLNGSVTGDSLIESLVAANLAIDANDNLFVPDPAVVSALDGQAIAPQELTLGSESAISGFEGALSVDANDNLVATDTDTDTQLTDEEVQDLVGAFVSGGTNVSVNYDDGNNTLTISATDTDTTYSAGTGLSLSSETFSTESVPAADLDQSGATTDQHLAWDGSAWVPVDPPSDTDTQTLSVEKSGSVTLSSGSAIVSTTLSEPVEVTLDPTDGGSVSQQIEVSATARNDGSGTIEVKIYETGTDVGNPTIGYDILTVN
jgi:hypothetical protein